MKIGRVLPATICATVFIALVLGACGAGDNNTETTMAGPETTATTVTSEVTSEGQTVAEAAIDEELLGTWVSEQGIQLEFTEDGTVTLSYGGSEAQSPYSAKDGKISYTDFEPNKAGQFLPTEVRYEIDGDTLRWDVGGGGELTLTRK
jgi:hypothetical protein